jgi:hypothetical protein
MTYNFIADSWRELMRLRDVAAEYEHSNETSLGFLKMAAKLDGDVLSRLRRKGEEVRFVLDQSPDPMVKLLLQELAESYERFG